MRLKITHTSKYSYETPVDYSLQRLRLTPAAGPQQTVLDWKVEVDGATVEAGYDDHFGNHVQLVSYEGESHGVQFIATGEVETRDGSGVYGPHSGMVPLWLFLRDKPSTKAGRLVRELVRSLPAENELSRCHALMEAVHATVAYVPGATSTETTAEEALEARKGVCQDHAHILISAARVMGLPARYVSGYLMMDEQTQQAASHAWAEIHLPGLGWVGFDAANDVCPDERYVRLASGLCYSDAAPISGMRIATGDSEEVMTVSVVVENQSQSQSQS
ncbi:transglutaminase family protein [Rhizobium halophytocola]|uniref:Transglutaminase-like putative cysteine protease n=1 Tax=Rhizobium halophytocola TaxID=735519 RepID=A0ABS4DSE9_9HYPH|nr:transglutaminase family protein [Rhizobium halophytocola]MBP1848624.1 transglutaminase-like putative cysteine protease [Rhizobium halophytocola]